MTKGHKGESCSDAIKNSIKLGEILSFTELYNNLRKNGTWRDETIWQHLMAVVVNLPPARFHWRSVEPFLFIRPDGRYEVYDRNIHPEVIN
jgi:hypothetical protein